MVFFKQCALPPRIEHVQLIQPDDMRRMAELGIAASMQPIHAVSDRLMAEKYWGNRCKYAYAWRSVKMAGTQIVFGSDAPVESPNPFLGISSAMTRKPIHNWSYRESWIPEQCLNQQEALEAYIINPHELSGWSNELGKIASGYLADLVILPHNYFELESNEINTTLPERVMVNGKWI